MSVIAPKIKPELAAELVKLAQQGGDLWGPEGLFQQLKKAMVDQMLEAEMDVSAAWSPSRSRELSAA
jgi:hypothetical protein